MTQGFDDIYHLPLGYQVERNGLVLTLTEDGWRAEVQHSMMRRCKGWDYCKPWIYLVTIGCQHHDVAPRPLAIPNKVQDAEILIPIPATWQYPQWLFDAYSRPGKPHLFGDVAGDNPDTAYIALNDFGKSVEEQIMSIPQYYPSLRIIEKVVMPNHIHIVIQVLEQLPEKKPLGFYMDRFKNWVNRRYKEVALGLPANTNMSPLDGGGLVFGIGFHDRILFRVGQLRNMIEYTRDNPRRLWMVKHNRQYFETVQGVSITMPLLSESGTAGRRKWQGPVEGLLAPVVISGGWQSTNSWGQSSNSWGQSSNSWGQSSNSGGQSSNSGSSSTTGSTASSPAHHGSPHVTVTFTIIGNRDLLKAPERMQIQCSRSMSDADIETQKAEVIEACKHGVVPISPCISPGEKAIARAVMEEGFNLIALLPQGIPDDTTYKPYKQFFDACANGQLLILSPWRYENGVKHLARWQCLFLNDIAMQLMVEDSQLADVV